MYWSLLLAAIVCEVVGTACLKASGGLQKLLPSVLVCLCYGSSLSLFAVALKGIDVGVAYAVWAGVGTALITVIGMSWFREPITVLKLFFIVIIVVGAAGLHLTAGPGWPSDAPP